jgi:hypothetical protein
MRIHRIPHTSVHSDNMFVWSSVPGLCLCVWICHSTNRWLLWNSSDTLPTGQSATLPLRLFEQSIPHCQPCIWISVPRCHTRHKCQHEDMWVSVVHCQIMHVNKICHSACKVHAGPPTAWRSSLLPFILKPDSVTDMSHVCTQLPITGAPLTSVLDLLYPAHTGCI